MAMKLKHANPSTGQVDLISVTHAQFERIQQYFRSFGFNVYYEATPFTQFDPDNQSDSTPDGLPSLSDISTDVSPATATHISHNLDDLNATQADTLKDYFITLKTEQVKFRVWFDFLQT